MIDHLDDIFFANIDVSNESGDIVFDTGVSDHESIRGISKENIVKLFNKSKQDLKGVKREVISKTVNDSRTGSKFLVKRVKCWKDFIKSIIHINKNTPNLHSLA